MGSKGVRAADAWLHTVQQVRAARVWAAVAGAKQGAAAAALTGALLCAKVGGVSSGGASYAASACTCTHICACLHTGEGRRRCQAPPAH